MSGGVGPISDIRLPKEEEEEVEHKQHEDFKTPLSKKQSTANAAVRGGGGYFSFRQLNALAATVVLAASGMVGVEDFAFVLFSLVYIHLISRIAFPILSPNAESPVFASNNKILGIYVSVGALVGLFLPIVYIFEGIFEGDKEGTALIFLILNYRLWIFILLSRFGFNVEKDKMNHYSSHVFKLCCMCSVAERILARADIKEVFSCKNVLNTLRSFVLH